MELLVIAIFFRVVGAQQSHRAGPENTVSAVGSDVSLKCSLFNCNNIFWQKHMPGISPINLFSKSQGMHSAFRDRYSVDNSSGCDLVIKNVEMTDDGLFSCVSVISNTTVGTTAYLTILETQPKCTVDASPDNTLEGDRVRLICEVVYNGTNIVSLVWKGVDDASAAVKSGITISRSFSVAASPPVIPAFSCITSFEVKDEYTHLATNIPSVTCETRTVKVQYQLTHTTTCTPDDNLQIGIGIGVGIGFGIGLLAAILLASIASVILVKQGFLEFHHRSADKSLADACQPMGQERHPSCHQLSTMHPAIPTRGAPLVGKQESAYASLGVDRGANEYESLQQGP